MLWDSISFKTQPKLSFFCAYSWLKIVNFDLRGCMKPESSSQAMSHMNVQLTSYSRLPWKHKAALSFVSKLPFQCRAAC